MQNNWTFFENVLLPLLLFTLKYNLILSSWHRKTHLEQFLWFFCFVNGDENTKLSPCNMQVIEAAVVSAQNWKKILFCCAIFLIFGESGFGLLSTSVILLFEEKEMCNSCSLLAPPPIAFSPLLFNLHSSFMNFLIIIAYIIKYKYDYLVGLVMPVFPPQIFNSVSN